MSWQATMRTIVRHLVDDSVSPYTFSDSRLEEAIVVSAQLLVLDTDFGQVYTVNIPATGITPDPVDSVDNSFVNLVSLKAGCLVLGSKIQTESANSISVTDGPSQINMGGNLAGYKMVYEDLCSRYDESKLNYQAGGRAGTVILGPYSPGSDVVSFTSYR